MVDNKEIELIISMGVGRSGLPNENEVITSALRELFWYRKVGTVDGYKTAIWSSLEYYNRMKEYEAKVQSLQEKTKKIHPRFSHNINDTTSYWVCECGNGFKTNHEPGILKGTDVLFCSKCGVEFEWMEE